MSLVCQICSQVFMFFPFLLFCFCNSLFRFFLFVISIPSALNVFLLHFFPPIFRTLALFFFFNATWHIAFRDVQFYSVFRFLPLTFLLFNHRQVEVAKQHLVFFILSCYTLPFSPGNMSGKFPKGEALVPMSDKKAVSHSTDNISIISPNGPLFPWEISQMSLRQKCRLLQ